MNIFVNIFRFISKFIKLFNFGGNQKIQKVKVQDDGVEMQIYKEIEKLHQRVTNHHLLLNQIAPSWLLVGSISCWSLPFLSLRLLGAFIFLCVFFSKIGSRKDGIKESFLKTVDRIEEKIKSLDFEKKTQESMFYQLQKERGCIKGASALKNTWIFIVCMFFYSLNFTIFLDLVVVSICDKILASL